MGIELFSTDNEVSVVRSLTDSETVEMVLNQGDYDNNKKKKGVHTGEKVPAGDLLKMYDGLIKGLEQHAFITEQEIMPV